MEKVKVATNNVIDFKELQTVANSHVFSGSVGKSTFCAVNEDRRQMKVTFEQWCGYNDIDINGKYTYMLRRTWNSAIKLNDANNDDLCPRCLGDKNDPDLRGINDCTLCNGEGYYEH